MNRAKKSDLVVSEFVINNVTVHDLKLRKIKWVLDWARLNPARIDALAEIMRQLNRNGIKMFGHIISYCHKKYVSDPIACAKRTLKYQKLDAGIRQVRRVIRTNGKAELTLSNGTLCTVTCDRRGDYWVSLLNYGTRIRLRMWVGQVVSLKNIGAGNVKMVKRITPSEARYFKDGRWHLIPYHRRHMAMTAIAAAVPLEIVALLED